MPVRLTSPSVGLSPAIPQAAAGQMIEPSVSVPTANGARRAATAAADPDEEPPGLRSSEWGLRVWPPAALQPLDERLPRKLAHSDRFVLPSTTAPASRSTRTRGESAGGEASPT